MESNDREMIVFDHSHVRFNYRVAAVITDHGRVLLHRAENDPFWSLPGGRVELMENAQTALVREMREELGIETEVVRLLWVAENFFTYDGMPYHELCLYFLLHVVDPQARIGEQEIFWGREEQRQHPLIFQWFAQNIPTLQSVQVLPAFLTEGLVIIPEVTIHIVSSE